MGDNENSYFKVFLNVHNHLGEIQPLRHPGVGHWPRTVPGNGFFWHFFWKTVVQEDENQKALPGDSLCKCLTPGCQRCWTSPRRSWISGNNGKLLFPSSPITFVTTKSPKCHSLWHPLFNALLLAVRGCWTSPRWSWSSRKNLKQLFASSTITSVTTTLSKSHSLIHPLEMPYS